MNKNYLIVTPTDYNQSIVVRVSSFYSGVVSRTAAAALLIILSVCLGCQGFSPAKPASGVRTHLVSEPVIKKDLLSVNSLVVKPFEFDSPQIESAVQEAILREELERAFREEVSLEVIPSKQVFKASPELISSKEIPTDIGLDAARKQNVEGVLELRLHEFQERVGSAVGATTPAKVFFTVRLMRTSDAHEVWRASYNFSDKAVSENLLQIKDRFYQSEQGVPTKQGLGWKSAQELLRTGFRRSAEEFATLRLDSFTGDR